MKRETKQQIVLVLFALGAILGTATCVAGLVVAIQNGYLETINYICIIGGWIFAALNAFFGTRLSRKVTREQKEQDF